MISVFVGSIIFSFILSGKQHYRTYTSVTSLQAYLFYNQKIIDPCGTYIQSQVNTGINMGIIYN